jgi:predicted 3-demethylubiquinone-9 3-methyltransferase (glyoxalase superfamily)
MAQSRLFTIARMSALANYPRISPFLWFDKEADEAVTFYLSIFKNSRRLNVLEADKAPQGKPLTVAFELDGQKFTALNGGPMFKFNEAVSFVVRCESQQEIDDYWDKLIADGGSPGRCGWLKDKFGLSWQVIPVTLPELLRSPAAMQAMMGMNKLDIAALEAAASS